MDVVDDLALDPLFQKECWSRTDTAFRERKYRFCVSDEHYIPTLLAYLGPILMPPSA